MLGFRCRSGPGDETERTLVSHSGCIDLRRILTPSVPDPFKHRMKRVGIAGFQLVSVLLGSISSLLGPTRLFYYIPFPFPLTGKQSGFRWTGRNT